MTANRYTRRQFFGISALAATFIATAPKPCWELNPNNPNWCPSPTPTPSPTPEKPPPPPSPATRRLLLLF